MIFYCRPQSHLPSETYASSPTISSRIGSIDNLTTQLGLSCESCDLSVQFIEIPTVAQFPDDHSRIYSRGKYYIRLYVRTSIKCTFKIRSPIGRISDSAFYATRAEADREVLGHRCHIEGLEKHGEEWFVPASSPAAKVKNISFDAEVVAIERNIKSLRIAIEDKANRIQSLETQLRTERSTLATLEAVVLTRNFIILLFCLYEP